MDNPAYSFIHEIMLLAKPRGHVKFMIVETNLNKSTNSRRAFRNYYKNFDQSVRTMVGVNSDGFTIYKNTLREKG